MISLASLSALAIFSIGCHQNTEADESPLLTKETFHPAPSFVKPGTKVEKAETEEPQQLPVTGLGQPLTVNIERPLSITMDIEKIREEVRYFALRKSERVWDKIPWVTDYTTAQALSQESQRPIFLFSMWGELDGRC